MVCVTEEEWVVCWVHYDIDGGNEEALTPSANAKISTNITLRASNSVESLIQKICKSLDLEEQNVELFLQKRTNGIQTMIPLNECKNKLLKEIGLESGQDNPNYFVVRDTSTSIPVDGCNGVNGGGSGDELLLGASASPTAGETAPSSEDPLLISVLLRQDVPYVGLVNQAMTCYLNSLLQALYMTPEFRNALYNWVFDGHDAGKSIPYQLQKLFLNLQTTTKHAVETTELTRSFGWDLSEAWQQHDIQELCRVMFDALEQKFKDTEQADLINRLYQGKMIDYVKCLDCGTEKSRIDTFLDIPLPVRPFGSTVAYGSVEEALRAFVQPETLDGNNQYFCERCSKKCDAHKGLKFSSIPYLLTLHLKRFDFDYTTMHRIKLNDKVTFPETLDLNSFVTNCDSIEATTSIVLCDDSSTTDSGSALDDESASAPPSTSAASASEDDEGIDVSISENEKNRQHEAKGPYIYELFSIMIHSGSASGGHYYAYIKDLRKGSWYCFDDQNVTPITYDDIRKTYGGGPLRSYYSGAYSSSTNAYMLMYRQVDPTRNVFAMTAEEFPPHITKLLQNLREREETDRITREREMVMCKLKMYYHHPNQTQQFDTRLFLHNDSTLAEAVQEGYRKAKLDGIVPIEQCRLVAYNRLQDSIECSFENRDEEPISDILASLKCSIKTDWLLEIRNKDQEWIEYKPGGINIKVYLVDLESEEVKGPVTIRGYENQTVQEFKMAVAKALNLNESTLKIALEAYSNGSVEPTLLECGDDELIGHVSLCTAYKVYVGNSLDEDPDKPFIISKFHKIIDKFEHIISLDVVLPVNDKLTLEVLSIPPLDVNQNCEKIVESGAGEPAAPLNSNPPSSTPSGTSNAPSATSLSTSPKLARVSPVPGSCLGGGGHSDQSNSEDSSLSDSDRTLVGDAPDECLAQLSSTSNSPAASEQHLSSPEDPHNVFLEENWDEELEANTATRRTCPNWYFKATEVPSEPSEHVGKTLKVLVDKRTNLVKLKKELEPYVGVPMEYFKIYRQHSTQEVEYSKLTETLQLYRDGEKLVVKLGRVLRENEQAGKVYQLIPNASDPIRFLCDWVVAKGQTVGQAKKEILEAIRKQYQIDIPFNRCRLRKKNWKNPSSVYRDDQKFVDDFILHSSWEMFIQELPEDEISTNSDQLILFIRQWCPSTMELKPFQEIALEGKTVQELKQKISEISEIPVENVEIALLKGTFPYDMSILGIHSELEWNSSAIVLSDWHLNVYDDGAAFLYRDSREPLKQLTADERKEILGKESAKMGRFSKAGLYSPRKEKALKIYLDTSPKKSDYPDVD